VNFEERVLPMEILPIKKWLRKGTWPTISVRLSF